MIVISGPSGVGKGTVLKRLLEICPGLVESVSCTTRAPRPHEVDGTDYWFISNREFDRMIGEGAFLEWANVYGHRSGTPLVPIARANEAGRPIVLEIDVQGAAQVKERVPGAVLVFLAPPSDDELARRLRSRGTESDEEFERRIGAAREEMAQESWFDHVVVNDEVDQAAADVAAIIGCEPDRS